MTTIRATGTASRRIAAELATISVQVQIIETDRALSISQAGALHNAVVKRAKQLVESGDATRFEAYAARTYSRRTPTGPGDEARAASETEHTTMSSVAIEVANLDLVSDLVLEFSAAGGETSVTWALTEASRLERERAVRQQAVGEARAVASDYAAALGETIQQVTSISDSLDRGFMPHTARAAVAFEMMGSAAEVTVQEIEVSARIVGVFESG